MKNLIIIIWAITMLLLSSCEKNEDCINGSGSYVTKEYSINEISSIGISSVADVYLVKGETSLSIEGQANILEALHVTDNAGHLEIGKDNCFQDLKTLKIYLSTPSLDGISTSGKISVTSSDTFTAENFYLANSGVLNMNLPLNASELHADFSGEIDVTLTGVAETAEYNISGLGNIHAFNLATNNTEITISGDVLIETTVKDNLDITISGSGVVHYKGSPSISQEISGNGMIVNKN